ncbi:MAG: xanthine dehydrogenase family protein [Acidobacteria bacterium]|nr:xanthine dehydrogenase family protein [Acidobacteriota bacterium]
MSKSYRHVGQSVRRGDVEAKIRGTAGFGVDITPPGCLWGRVVRANAPHGRMKKIAFDPAFDWAGFTRLTADDVPGKKILPYFLQDQPFLAFDTVKFPGDPVALLAHEDPDALERALSHVHVEVEPLPAAFTIEDSLALEAALWEGDNVFWEVLISKGDPGPVLTGPGVTVFDEVYETGSQEQLYLEPQNVIAFNEDGRIRILGSIQCPYYVKPGVEAALGEPVDVEQSTTGGAFGGKEDYPTLLAAWAAMLAKKSGRTVKMVFDRDEDFAYTTKRHPSRTRVRSAVGPDGKLLAMDIDFALDAGAYCTLSPVVLSRGALHAGSAYLCPNLRILGRAVATNTPPTGAFRGFGAPQGLFAVERHMDVMAHRLGRDPLEFRRLNLLRNGDTNATGQLFRWEKNLHGVLDRALELSRFEETRKAAEENNRSDAWRKRGVGLSLFFHGSGFTGSGETKMRSVARLEADPEGFVVIRVSSVEMGQGARTVLAQMVAETMGIGLDQVRYPNPDTARVPNTGPTVASRTTAVVGGILVKAAEALRRRIEDVTGRVWEDGEGFARTLRAVPYGIVPLAEDAVYEPPPGLVWDEETFRGEAYADYAWACYVAEVEADLRDYTVTVKTFTAVQDVGTVIHPELARGQVEGGVVQGIGWTLTEKVHFKDGRVLNPGFSDYIILTPADLPELRVDFVQNPSPHGGYGAKGLGELPMDGPAPAILAALHQALGREFNRIPLTPSDLFRELETDGKS